MRKLIVAMFVSLDGVMQAPGGPEEDTSGGFALGGWTFPLFDEAGGKGIDALFDTPFALLLGRRTYDIFAGYWPNHGDHPIGAKFNAATKYVATHGDATFGWENTQVLRGDAVSQVADLKKGEGPTLLTQGSSVLVQDLWAAGLVDELRLMTFPVVLGKGKRLWAEGARPGALKVVRSEVTGTGVVMTTYAPDGAVRTGSF